MPGIRCDISVSESSCVMSAASEALLWVSPSFTTPAGFAGNCAATTALSVRKLNVKLLISYSFLEDNIFFTNNLATVRSSSSSSECLTKALGVSSEGSLESNEVGFSIFLSVPSA